MKVKNRNKTEPHPWELLSCIRWCLRARSVTLCRFCLVPPLALCLLCTLWRIAWAAEPPANSFEKGSFRIDFDEHGITGLANPKDPFGAQMLAAHQRLDFIVRVRAGDTNWLELSSGAMQLSNAPSSGQLVYTNNT